MTKSRKRMLLSSIAMLLVALVALGSATYAWFTINKVVTADTIKVKAVVSSGLVINNKKTADWQRTVSFSSTAKDLYPVSINVPATDGGNSATLGTPYYAKDVNADAQLRTETSGVTAKGFTATEIPSAFDNGDLQVATNDYVAVYTVDVAASGDAAIEKAVTASITATGTTPTATGAKSATTFAKAALLKDNKIIGFYSDGKYNAITGAGDAPTTAEVAEANDTGITAIAANPGVPSKDTTPVTFKLVVWFEGNDADCINASQTAEANFTLTFTLAD